MTEIESSLFLLELLKQFRKQCVISPPKLDLGFFGSHAVIFVDAVEMPPLQKSHHFLLETSLLK